MAPQMVVVSAYQHYHRHAGGAAGVFAGAHLRRVFLVLRHLILINQKAKKLI